MTDRSAPPSAHEPPPPPDEAPPDDGPASPPPRLSCLAAAYPDAIDDVVDRGGDWTVIFADGREARWDDGQTKEAETRLAEPDLEDTLAQTYPVGEAPAAPAEGFEPGRVRHAALMENAYGEDERAVREHLESIPWPTGGAVRFSSRNGAADALREVVARLSSLPDEAQPCIEPPIHSFFHRNIRGTDRLSPHAFGVAIDLNSECGEYWRWQRPFEGRWRSRMHPALVELFEAHGFVWGGRWYHYDTFHFEYRPELLRCR